MTGDKSLFKTLKEKEDGYVTFRDGSHSQVLGKRTVDILGFPLLTDVLVHQRIESEHAEYHPNMR